mmetsp:Transcript_68420/g.198392  ORF Transcript_68420/g.198392 Transcript_68420/m.198392 type:complete len:227 (+) Transcript_68420:57-737(+)
MAFAFLLAPLAALLLGAAPVCGSRPKTPISAKPPPLAGRMINASVETLRTSALQQVLSSHGQMAPEATESAEEDQDGGKKSKRSVFGTMGGMFRAASDPRATLAERKEVKEFGAALKVVIDVEFGGRCPTHGKFEGLGCADDGKTQQLCTCTGHFAMCDVPNNVNELIRSSMRANVEDAMNELAEVVFGRCKTDMTKVWALTGGVVLAFLCVAGAAWLLISRRRSS